jgi:PD-(D/E)XK endonuclease
MVVRKYSPDDIDLIAAYCRDTSRCYVLPPRLFSGRRVVHLRVAPCRNNQKVGVNRADDYELGARLESLRGAVAQLGERSDGIRKVRGSIPLGSITASPMSHPPDRPLSAPSWSRQSSVPRGGGARRRVHTSVRGKRDELSISEPSIRQYS